MPRDLIRAPQHDRKRSLGWLALAFIEHFCVHGPGDVEGAPLDPSKPGALPLDTEFAGIIVDLYTVDGNGRRLYDSGFISRAKGRAKSELAAFIAIFEAIGPCRFSGWARGGEVFTYLDFRYEYQPGEPMGVPVTYPFIRCLATEEGQAGNTFDNILYNFREGPLSEVTPGDMAALSRIVLPESGVIIPSTASNSAKDGGKETFVVFDETHLYILGELIRMYATVRRNLAKRKSAQPWSLETSTMYMPGEDSVAEETHKLAVAIREGRVKRPRLFFDHRCASDGLDLADEGQVTQGLRESYGPFADVMDLQRIVDEIWDIRNDPADSRRYFFNLPQSAADAWITKPQLDACRAPLGIGVTDKEPIVLGFDGSRHRSKGITDATAIIAVRVRDGYSWPIGIWEQPEGPDGVDWQVPVAEIDLALDRAFESHYVVGFFADPARWETNVAEWEAKFGNRLLVKASRRHPIEWWMNSDRKIVAALESAKDAILQGEMTHNGDSAFTRHLLNARARQTRSGVQVYKENRHSPRKIDAAIAWVIAWQARLDALAAGITEKKATGVPFRIR